MKAMVLALGVAAVLAAVVGLSLTLARGGGRSAGAGRKSGGAGQRPGGGRR